MPNENSSEKLNQLLQTPLEKRPSNWEEEFLRIFPSCSLRIMHDTPQVGPDRWPYLLVSTNMGDEPATEVLTWLSSRGIGMALNAHKSEPDYVFPYGMIWNFVHSGRFIEARKADSILEEKIMIRPGQQLWIGEPSKTLIPDYVRSILRQFFSDQGLKSVQWAMVSKDQINFDLCFSMQSFGNPSLPEQNQWLKAMSWFLPMHMSIAMFSADAVGQDFFSL